MARNSLTDYLTTYPFWLMDVAPVSGVAIPIFVPLSGFSSISSPEIVHEVETVKEGNWYFKNKVIKGADITPITLRRGGTATNSDFWRWMHAATRGTTKINRVGVDMSVGGPTYRRTLVLVQFFSHSPATVLSGGRNGTQDVSSAAGGLAAATAAASLVGLAGTLGSGSPGPAISAGVFAGGALAANLLLDGTKSSQASPFALRIPAKAWILYGCVPIRYNAASPFDASNAAVSIQELDLAVEYFEEISLMS